MEYQIGQFSHITQITVKALHLYHEKGLLEPERTDPFTGYRYYGADQIERARIISELKSCRFTLPQIGEILRNCETDEEVKTYIVKKQSEIAAQIRQFREIEERLQLIIDEKQSDPDPRSTGEIIVKEIPATLIASHRFTGRYNEIGKAFGKIYKAHGRHTLRPDFCLHHNLEYRETDAHMEACVPLKRERPGTNQIRCYTLPASEVTSIIHRGPYSTLGRSYRQLIDYINETRREIQLPFREIYHRGPGFLFKGNPEKYITEIQITLK